MHIHRVDVGSPEQLQLYADLVSQGNREDWGEELAQHRTAEEFRLSAEEPTSTVDYYTLHVSESERPLGFMDLAMSDVEEPDAAYVYIRVLKAVQGYGMGTDALRFAIERVRAAGRSRLLGMSAARSQRDNRNVRFLLRNRFEERIMLLRQDAVPGRLDVAELTKVAAPLGEGFSVATREAPLPPEWVSEMLEAEPRFHTDSWAQLPEDAGYDLETVMESHQQAVGSGRRIVFTIARDEAGRVAGYAETRFGAGDKIGEAYPPFIAAGRPATLGAALRADTLLHLREHHPDLPRVRTFFPADDLDVAALNRRVGYSDVAFYREWELHL